MVRVSDDQRTFALLCVEAVQSGKRSTRAVRGWLHAKHYVPTNDAASDGTVQTGLRVARSLGWLTWHESRNGSIIEGSIIDTRQAP